MPGSTEKYELKERRQEIKESQMLHISRTQWSCVGFYPTVLSFHSRELEDVASFNQTISTNLVLLLSIPYRINIKHSNSKFSSSQRKQTNILCYKYTYKKGEKTHKPTRVSPGYQLHNDLSTGIPATPETSARRIKNFWCHTSPPPPG